MPQRIDWSTAIDLDDGAVSLSHPRFTPGSAFSPVAISMRGDIPA